MEVLAEECTGIKRVATSVVDRIRPSPIIESLRVPTDFLVDRTLPVSITVEAIRRRSKTALLCIYFSIVNIS